MPKSEQDRAQAAERSCTLLQQVATQDLLAHFTSFGETANKLGASKPATSKPASKPTGKTEVKPPFSEGNACSGNYSPT